LALELTQLLILMFKYQGYLLGEGGEVVWCLGLTTLPLSRIDCLEILGASASWSPKGLSNPLMGKLYIYIYIRTVPYSLTAITGIH
jgi:hypothetical protein